MNKVKYIINIEGCDDETTFVMELTNEELELVREICKKSQETSTYCCMPRMYIEEYTKENINKYSYTFLKALGLTEDE